MFNNENPFSFPRNSVKNETFIRNTMKTIAIIPCLLALLVSSARAGDPLPSWQDTAPKKAIVAFVGEVTKPGSRGFVPVAPPCSKAT